MAETTFPPIPLPRRFDRRLRLGPFPSARDAMKFAGYAAAGTLVLPIGGPVAWLPVLGVGFLLSVYRPDGRGIDERAGEYLRYRLRRRTAPGPPTAGPGEAPGTIARLPGPFVASVLETGGVPIRFLPPDDARTLFEGYRELLRAVDPGVVLDVATTSSLPSPIGRRPKAPPAGPAEAAAREGYGRLLALLLRRRRRRRVRVVLFAPLDGAPSLDRLEERTTAVATALGGLGLSVERLSGARLAGALAAIGWARGGER